MLPPVQPHDLADDLGPDLPAEDRPQLDLDFGAPADRRVLGAHLIRAWLASVDPGFPLLTPAEIHQHVLACHGVDEEIAVIGSQLHTVYGGSDESRRRMTTEIARFAERLRLLDVVSIAHITEQHVEDFIHEAVPQGGGWSPPATGTMHLRRSAVRLVLRTARQLHVVDPAFDPTADITLPPRTTLRNRPLTDEEELEGRFWSTGTGIHTRRPAAWALGQASATSGEILQAVIADLDLPRRRVWLRGTRNRAPRSGLLTEWGVEQLAERVDHLRADGHGDDAPLVRSPDSTYRSGQTQSSNAVRETLDLARLADEPDISPKSLPNWRGRQVFKQTGRIDEAAKALGIASLDSTALAINWTWR